MQKVGAAIALQDIPVIGPRYVFHVGNRIALGVTALTRTSREVHGYTGAGLLVEHPIDTSAPVQAVGPGTAFQVVGPGISFQSVVTLVTL